MNPASGNVRKGLVVLVPLLLTIILFLAFGGAATGQASSQYQYDDSACWGGHPAIISPFGIDPATGQDYWNTPNQCNAEPWGVNDNPLKDLLQGTAPDDRTIDGYYTADQLLNQGGTGLLQDSANKGHVHIIDVRVPQEDVSGIAPCLTALGVPTYPTTDLGHPIWQWPDGTWEESYFVPVFAGYSWAGTQRIEDGQVLPASDWARNVRPEPNPNFVDIGAGSYFRALADQGEISKDDTLVIMCQSGWRASFAATIIKNQGYKHVYVLYGGMLGWSDDYYNDDFQTPGDPDNVPGPAFDRDIKPENGESCAPGKRCAYVPGFAQQQTAVWNPNLNQDSYTRHTYNITRLVLDGQVPMWDGKETHIGVTPEWLAGFGAVDFKLKAAPVQKAYWASQSDYQNRILTVSYGFSNVAPDYVADLSNPDSATWKANYVSDCGGAPLPLGSCHPVLFDPWGPSMNTRVTGVNASDGVTPVKLGATPVNGIGIVPPATVGQATIKFQVPDGVTSFTTNPLVEATDVPDASLTLFGANMAFFFTYHYNHFQVPVTVPPAPGGLLCLQPTLTRSVTNVYWASYADYQSRTLSVDYRISNSGLTAAQNVQITGTAASGGVSSQTAMPLAAGNIAAEASQTVTVRYSVPAGVSSFRASITASAADSCGGSYSYN